VQSGTALKREAVAADASADSKSERPGRGVPGLFANPNNRASWGWYRLDCPRIRLAERLVQAVSVGRPHRNAIGERLVRAVAPGDDSQPGACRPRWSSRSMPTSTGSPRSR
jgi:hypothetical protein